MRRRRCEIPVEVGNQKVLAEIVRSESIFKHGPNFESKYNTLRIRPDELSDIIKTGDRVAGYGISGYAIRMKMEKITMSKGFRFCLVLVELDV